MKITANNAKITIFVNLQERLKMVAFLGQLVSKTKPRSPLKNNDNT